MIHALEQIKLMDEYEKKETRKFMKLAKQQALQEEQEKIYKSFKCNQDIIVYAPDDELISISSKKSRASV